MRLLLDFNRVMSGVFLSPSKPIYNFETRAERRKRVTAKRNKQWDDSFKADGVGYHKQKGWF